MRASTVVITSDGSVVVCEILTEAARQHRRVKVTKQFSREPLLWGNRRRVFTESSHVFPNVQRFTLIHSAPLPVGAHEVVVSCQPLFHLICCSFQSGGRGGQGQSAGDRQAHGRLCPDWTAIGIISKKKTSMFVFLMAPRHVCGSG